MLKGLLVRADANQSMGHGHVMRCLALAQAWIDAGGNAHFLCHEPSEAVRTLLERNGIAVIPATVVPGSIADAEETNAVARQHRCEWVVVDGYHFHTDYQDCLKRLGSRVLLIDDNGERPYYSADIVLNQNIHAGSHLYPFHDSGTTFLLGLEYAMLRHEIRSEPRERAPRNGDRRNILLTMGGSDPLNRTREIYEVLLGLNIPNIRVSVLLGSGYTHPYTFLPEEYDENSSVPTNVFRNPASMVPLLRDANVAITAAGSTIWELCYFGIPAILVITADNQRRAARELSARNAALLFPENSAIAPSVHLERMILALWEEARWQEIARSARSLVDGEGVHRILVHMFHH